MILIDNYDSFTYNIVQYLKELGIEPRVFKNDEITISKLKKMGFSSIIISPGPKNPDQAGISLDVIGEFYKTKKILGVCLGHQCIAQYFGCKIIKSENPTHGKVSKIYFKGVNVDPIFEGIEQGFEATRYHSLIVDNESLTDCILPLAYTEDAKTQRGKDAKKDNTTPYTSMHPCIFASGHRSSFTIHHSLLMALKHKDYPVYGVQFHPEAILTQYGKKLLENFILL